MTRRRGRPTGHRPANAGKIGVRHPPRTAVRIMRDFFAVMDADGRSAQAIAERAGNHKVTISYWRHGARTPSLLAFEAACQAMGYRLTLTPIEGDER